MIAAAPPAALRWLEGVVGVKLTADAKGLCDTKRRAVIAFDNWTETAAFAHIACETPIAWRRLLPEALKHYFAYRPILLSMVRADNTASRAFTEHAGAQMVAQLVGAAAPGVDMLLYELRREKCRWLEVR